MSLSVAAWQARSYQVETPIYEGPLDLLLQLIERAELDITRLALAQVTDQYLAHLQTIQDKAADEVSAFLVIAARLVQIKSEALLPRPPEREAGEEDPGEALARQLALYKRFKQTAEYLGEREKNGLRTYLRLAPPPKVEARLDMSGLTLEDLIAAARQVFANQPPKTPLNTVVRAPKITIREKISQIITTLREHGRARFFALLGKVRSRLEVVVSFLALLELIKLRRVAAHQPALFDDIEIQPADAWSDDEDFELEFGE